MTAGKRRELRELESSLKVVENTEPAQLLEEERLRKEIAELRAKIDRVPLSTPSTCAIRTTKNVLSHPARR
jgi:uncharacterized sporulation protein YeaH/YhbH (DUF444 family)